MLHVGGSRLINVLGDRVVGSAASIPEFCVAAFGVEVLAGDGSIGSITKCVHSAAHGVARRSGASGWVPPRGNSSVTLISTTEISEGDAGRRGNMGDRGITLTGADRMSDPKALARAQTVWSHVDFAGQPMIDMSINGDGIVTAPRTGPTVSVTEMGPVTPLVAARPFACTMKLFLTSGIG